MANQDDNFFKVIGANEIAKALEELSRGAKNKIVRPGLRQAIAEIRKIAKSIVPVDDGHLKRAIQSKVITQKGKNRGVVGKIGVLDKKFTDENGVPVMKYAGQVNAATGFLDKANRKGKGAAIEKLKVVTAAKVKQFQKKMNAKAKAAK